VHTTNIVSEYGKQTETLVRGNPTDQILYSFESDVKYAGGSSGILVPGDQRLFPHIAIYSGSPANQNNLIATIFPSLILSIADVGNTQIATNGSSGFAGFASSLTDGQQQFLTLPTGLNSEMNRSEHAWFHTGPNDSEIDLHGYVLDKVTFTVKGWYYDSPGSDPNHNGFWTDAYFGYRLTFEGYAIPEPSTFTLAACALASLRMIRRRRL
jgi:hypothetical protein